MLMDSLEKITEGKKDYGAVILRSGMLNLLLQCTRNCSASNLNAHDSLKDVVAHVRVLRSNNYATDSGRDGSALLGKQITFCAFTRP